MTFQERDIYRETERWAQDKITMRQPHFSHLLLMYNSSCWSYNIKQKKVVRFGSVPFHFSNFWRSSLKVKTLPHKAAGETSKQEMLLTCRQLINLVPSRWLIQQDKKVQTVCTQCCTFGTQLNTSSPHFIKCCRCILTSNLTDTGGLVITDAVQPNIIQTHRDFKF